MKYINVRQLTRSLKEATAELPVRVTLNGLPIFDIVPVDGEKKILEKFPENANPVIKEAQSEEHREPGIQAVKCSYPLCKEIATAVGKMWNEETGEMEDMDMCQKHAVQSLREAIK